MSIPGAGNPLLLGGAAAGGYEIARSIRLNAPDSAYLSRTPASAGNRKTWTWAGWVKRSTLTTASRQMVFTGHNAFNAFIGFATDDKFEVATSDGSSANYLATSAAVFRDTSAWMHIVVAIDTPQASTSNRARLWVNGVQQTLTGSFIPQNGDTSINLASAHRIGSNTSGGLDFSGYLADIHFIDGQALDPTSFGEFDDNGIWQPKAFSGGSYGTNGFHLDFADNSAATATTLGKDTSGNGNNWTPNNLSVTAGAGNDSLVDSPTNYGTDTGAGGEVRGNYCTWNPLDKDADVTLTNGNLDMTQADAGGVKGTIAVSSGKWYWEINKTTAANQCFGIATTTAVPSTYVGGYAGSAGFTSAGTLYAFGNFSYANGAATVPLSSGDILGFALDLDSATKTLKIYRNGTLQTTNHFIITESSPLTPAVGTNTADNTTPGSANFGQRQWAFTPPAGFKALCTQNLPTPTIADGSTAMDVVLDTGANILTAAQGAIGGSADLLWIKDRANSNNYQLIDTVRGGTLTLQSNTTAVETTYSAPSGSSVAWTWDAGSSTVTNTDGTISSQVRANPSAGFSIVTYNTGSTANQTIGHGLGVSPSLIIAKSRTGGSGWPVYHASAGAGYLDLSDTAAFASNTNYWGTGTVINSSVFGVGNVGFWNNTGGMVAYCFAPVAGYSAFGKYTGNGAVDGPMVFTGFRPRWILTKDTTLTGSWLIHDTERDPFNVSNLELQANGNIAEYNTASVGAGNRFDILSNGFKHRTANSGANASGNVYIYAAFAEHPFAYSRAR